MHIDDLWFVNDSQLIELPEMSNEQEKALFNATINKILDANNTYKRKTNLMHRQIFEQEELYRYYSALRENFEANGKTHRVPPPRAFDPAECENFGVPIELAKLKTVPEAEEAYQRLLLEYIEHQSVLDQIIASKTQRVSQVESELAELGVAASTLFVPA